MFSGQKGSCFSFLQIESAAKSLRSKSKQSVNHIMKLYCLYYVLLSTCVFRWFYTCKIFAKDSQVHSQDSANHRYELHVVQLVFTNTVGLYYGTFWLSAFTWIGFQTYVTKKGIHWFQCSTVSRWLFMHLFTLSISRWWRRSAWHSHYSLGLSQCNTK